MIDVTAISHGLTSLNAMKNIAESMIGLRDAAVLLGKVVELNGKIIDAQQSFFCG